MAQTYKVGDATITVEDRALLRHIDRVSNGAGSTFIAVARPVLTNIAQNASDAWPRRTGRSASSFGVEDRVRPDKVQVAITNDARTPKGILYTYYVKWSVRTKASLDAEIDRAAARGESPEAQEAIRRVFGGRLRRRHGMGAPNAQRAGKSAWVTLVRRPAKLKRNQGKVLEDARDAIKRLAGV